MMRQLGISVLVVWSAGAAVPPVIPGDSERGARLFENQRCVECHSVNGKGGKMGMDLSARVDRGFTPALLASAMWNHAPVMWAAMEGAGIERPVLSPADAADLFAYLYSTRFFDKPGDAARGKQAFTDRHCAECHGITESRAEGAPPVVKWESLGQPIMLVQQMWDHSSRMREAFARKKIAWQELTAPGIERYPGLLAKPAGDARSERALLVYLGRWRGSHIRIEGLREMPRGQSWPWRTACTV